MKHQRKLKRPTVQCCTSTSAGRCKRGACFPSGRCGKCEEAAAQDQFAVLDSYLPSVREESS